MKDKSYEGNLELEQQIWEDGYEFIAGVDEVGRGCFAGPVVCAAVIMKKDVRIPYLTDSKKIPKKKHKELVTEIMKHAVSVQIAVIPAEKIDEINILQATLLGMKQAVEQLQVPPDFILVDGNQRINVNIPQQTVVKGDYYSHTISAASLVAKEFRDELMKKYDQEFDGHYKWATNAGYPTLEHIDLVKIHGLTPYHRRSWKKAMARLIE